MIRMFDCVNYNTCLDRAAKNGTSLWCDAGCNRYKRQEAGRPEDAFMAEMDRRPRTADGRAEGGQKMSDCKVTACDVKVQARGLCHTHYDEWRRGKPEIVALMGGPFVRIRNPRPAGEKPGRRKRPEAAPAGARGQKAENQPSSVVGQRSIIPELERVQRTIRVLVAAGFVSEEQLQAAYQVAGL